MSFKHDPYVTFEVKVNIADYAPESFGRCDCIMFGEDTLIITDYKHGKGVPVSAKENPQMMLYALGALKLYQPIFGNKIKNKAQASQQVSAFEDFAGVANPALLSIRNEKLVSIPNS